MTEIIAPEGTTGIIPDIKFSCESASSTIDMLMQRDDWGGTVTTTLGEEFDGYLTTRYSVEVGCYMLTIETDSFQAVSMPLEYVASIHYC